MRPNPALKSMAWVLIALTWLPGTLGAFAVHVVNRVLARRAQDRG